MSTLAPIALFVYNRPESLKKLLESLRANPESQESALFVFSEAPKTAEDAVLVKEVREIIHSITGFASVEIRESDEHRGSFSTVIDGVTEIVNRFGKIIVLEENQILSPCFLAFMNRGLELYADDENVACISGFAYPLKDVPETYFLPGAEYRGWATWQRAWDLLEPSADWLIRKILQHEVARRLNRRRGYDMFGKLCIQKNKKNMFWPVCWDASASFAEKTTLYPAEPLVLTDEISASKKKQPVKLADHAIVPEKIPDTIDHKLLRKYRRFRMHLPENRGLFKVFMQRMRPIYWTIRNYRDLWQ